MLLGCGRSTCEKRPAPTPDAPKPPDPSVSAPEEPEDPEEGADSDPASDEERALLKRVNRIRRTRKIAYRAPTEAEERAYGAWVSAAIRAAREGAPPPEGAPEGFLLERVAGAPHLWLLAERQRDRRGAGAIAIRAGRARELAVEAPHTFFDQGTLGIAAAVFETWKARALLVNTVHRYSALREQAGSPGRAGGEAGDEEGAKRSASDVAHAPRSFFQVGHEALLGGVPGLWTVQLHGFHDGAAPGVSVIVSAAGTIADAAGAASACRARLGDNGVRSFPGEVSILGGLTNVQARSSARAGSPFYHIEIGRSLRDRLGKDAAARRRFAEALPAPPEAAPPTAPPASTPTQ
jgi:hypothetical protein